MAVKYLKIKHKPPKEEKGFLAKFIANKKDNAHKGSETSSTVKKGLRLMWLWVIILLGVVTVSLVYFNVPFKLFNSPVLSPGARLVVSTEFIPAEVYLNDNFLGNTPLDISGLSAGSFTLKLKPKKDSPLFSTLEIPVKLFVGTATVVRAQIGPTSRTSSYSVVYLEHLKDTKLLVKTVEEGVSVILDGNNVGETPLVLKKIQEGKHTLKLQREGYRPIEIEIFINKDAAVVVEAKLYKYVLHAD